MKRRLRIWWHRLVAHPLNLCRCRAVWDAMLAEPGFKERLDKAIKQMDEGRWFRMERTPDGRHNYIPNPDWPKDGEQPSTTA